jgi:SAM-dependent methyltransferase
VELQPRLISNLIQDESLVTLVNDSFAIEKIYSGTYADLPLEEEQNIIDRLKHEPWEEVVSELFFESNPWLYKIICDPGRAQALDLINYVKNGVYLDVGAGWGQLSIPLAKHGRTVAFDLTLNRLQILDRIATQEGVMLEKIQGNFLSFPFKKDLFDLIIFNGSLEWIGSGREEVVSIREIQLNALKKAREILKKDGKLYIGIENSIGVKYIMGTPDDHTGISHLMYLSEEKANQKFEQSNNNLLPAKTWSLAEYYQLFDEAGFQTVKTYGCFPDYKLIRQMVEIDDVNRYILTGHLDVQEYNGANGEIVEHQEELRSIYTTLAKNNVAHLFCPSYGFVLTGKVG